MANDIKVPDTIVDDILDLSDSDPDTALELIKIVRNHSDFDKFPILRVAAAMAYGCKGLIHVLRQKPWINILTANKADIKDELGLTDEKLNYLELALQEVRKIEEGHPGYLKQCRLEGEKIGIVETKVEAVATALEKCRPGRVQQILGKTKLRYFGHERAFVSRYWEGADFKPFLDVFFTCDPIVRSALMLSIGTHKGCEYAYVALYEGVQIAEKHAAIVSLLDDGTFYLGLPPEEKPEKKEPEKKRKKASSKNYLAKEGI